jgi:hypothetical protein
MTSNYNAISELHISESHISAPSAAVPSPPPRVFPPRFVSLGRRFALRLLGWEFC